MKALILAAVLALVLAVPAAALEFEAPQAPDSVRQAVPDTPETFEKGLSEVIRYALQQWDPALREALDAALQVCAVLILCTVLRAAVPGAGSGALELAATVTVALALIRPSTGLIQMGINTVGELSEYGKLLLPVMTGALAAQGGVTSSAALCTGTVFFDALLSRCIQRWMLPIIYLYMAVSIANAALHEPILLRIRDFLRWAAAGSMKLILYLFTGYMAVSGLFSGSSDAAALKFTKSTIQAAVPVVGGILSGASDAVLASAGMLRSAAGVYGVLTVLALCAAPFLRLLLQQTVLKLLSALSLGFSDSGAARLVGDFSDLMGMLLAMVGTQCILQLISTVCFMKGVG